MRIAAVLLFALLALSLVSAADASKPKMLVGKSGKGVVNVFPSISDYDDFVGKMNSLGSVYKKNKEFALLSISTNEGKANAYIDGEYVGQTPLGVKLTPGVVNVRLRKEGYEVYDTEVVLSPGLDKNLAVGLKLLNPAYSRFAVPSSQLASSIGGQQGFAIMQDSLLANNKGVLFFAFQQPAVKTLGKEYFQYFVTGVAFSADGGKTWKYAGRQTKEPVPQPKSSFTKANLQNEDSDVIGVDYEGIAPAVDGGVYVYYVVWRERTRRSFNTNNGATTPTNLEREYDFRMFHANEKGVVGDYSLLSDPKKQLKFLGHSNGKYSFTRKLRSNVEPYTSSTPPDPLLVSSDGGRTMVQDGSSEYKFTPPTPSSSSYPGDPFGRYPSGPVRPYASPYSYFFDKQGKPYGLGGNEIYAKGGEFFTSVAKLGSDSIKKWTDNRAWQEPGAYSFYFDEAGNLHAAYRIWDSRSVDTNLYYQYFAFNKPSFESVSVFTGSGCASCADLKAFLADAKVSFSENPKLEEGLQASLDDYLKKFGYPVVAIRKSASDVLFMSGFDKIGLASRLGISLEPQLVTMYARPASKSKYGFEDSPHFYPKIYLENGNTPVILVQTADSMEKYSAVGNGWEKKKMFTLSAPAERAYRIYGGSYQYSDTSTPGLMWRANVDLRNEDDLEFMMFSSKNKVPLPGYSSVQTFVNNYDFYSTRIKESSSYEYSYGNSINPPKITAVVGPGKSFIYPQGPVEISADKDILLVPSSADCRGQDCLILDLSKKSLYAKITGETSVRVNDNNQFISSIKVEPIKGNGKLVFRQKRKDDRFVFVLLTFYKDVVRYVGDVTALSAEIEGDLLSVNADEYADSRRKLELGYDYMNNNQRVSDVLTFRGQLSKKAYLILRNKNVVYSNKNPPFVTENELVYLLEEMERVTEKFYGAENAAGNKVSKALWLKYYESKDVGGFSPWYSILAGGGTSSGSPFLYMRSAQVYSPGFFVDRDGDLVNAVHIYAMAALGDLQESEFRNLFRSFQYSVGGDVGLAYLYYFSGAICAVLCGQNTAQLAFDNAVQESTIDEIISDYYALAMRADFRHRSTKLSDSFKSFLGSETQKAVKAKAIADSRAMLYALGGA